MTSNTKNIILGIVILLIIVIAGIGYAYFHQHAPEKSSEVVRTSTSNQPAWKQGEENKIPPFVIVPKAATIIQNRYYIDHSTVHGEYSFKIDPGSYFFADPLAPYKEQFSRNHWIVDSSSPTSINAHLNTYRLAVSITQSGQAKLEAITFAYDQSTTH